MYRQGDVLIIRDTPPAKVTWVEQQNYVLAHGEATGHAHVMVGSVEVGQTADSVDRWLRLSSPATVTHQEHTSVTIPPGIYRVRRQREYTAAEIRQVRD